MLVLKVELKGGLEENFGVSCILNGVDFLTIFRARNFWQNTAANQPPLNICDGGNPLGWEPVSISIHEPPPYFRSLNCCIFNVPYCIVSMYTMTSFTWIILVTTSDTVRHFFSRIFLHSFSFVGTVTIEHLFSLSILHSVVFLGLSLTTVLIWHSWSGTSLQIRSTTVFCWVK